MLDIVGAEAVTQDIVLQTNLFSVGDKNRILSSILLRWTFQKPLLNFASKQ